MARKRIFEYGPSIRTPPRSLGLQTVSEQRIRNSRGVFLREGPGIDQARTAKSRLVPRPIRGIRPPGWQPPDYSSPNF